VAATAVFNPPWADAGVAENIRGLRAALAAGAK